MPDLLEALEALVEFADNGASIHPGALVLDDARQAIAEARGEGDRMISIQDVTADLQHQRAALAREICTLKLLIQPENTGHFHTTISVLEWRIGQIDSQIEVLGDTE